MKSKLLTRLTMVFATLLMFAFIANAQTTINVKIVDGGDDAEEYQQAKEVGVEDAGFMDITSSDVELCNESDGVQQMCGFIFRSVQIPVGATITNAYIQFTADDDNEEVITLDIWGGKVANVTAPWGVNQGDNPFAISSVPKTTALVQWTPVSWLVLEERGPDQQTPDISSIIQEIIGVAGWAPGNNLSIMFMDMSGTAKQHRETEAWEDNDGVGAAELFVTFTEGETSVNPVDDGISNSIYPNPTEGILNIQNPSTDRFSFEIYTINGKLVARRNNITGSTTEIDMINFAKGVYFVNVRNAEKTETHKLILK
ncbi:T9SS type A sorting domain-containing protein [Bacteroidota bacterium]